MRCLSVKEVMSVIQLIIAALCLLAVLLLEIVVPFPADLLLFALECVLMSTMIICVLFGLSTWFYNSNHSRTRLHVRIYSVLILWILLALLAGVAVAAVMNFLTTKLYGHFDMDSLFKPFQFYMLLTALGFTLGAGGLMLIMNCILSVLAVLKFMRLRRRRRNSARGSQSSQGSK